MVYTFYRTTAIGDGSFTNPKRSKLCDYIVNDGTKDFWDWVHDALPVRYALAWAEVSVHQRIMSDPDIKQISPSFNTVPEIDEWMNLPVEDVDILLIFEKDGFPMFWTTPETTHREVFRYISKSHVIMQEFRRARDVEGLKLFGRSLDDHLDTVTPLIKNRVVGFMQFKGMDTDVTTFTHVRQLIHRIINQHNGPLLSIGPVTL